MNKNIFFDFFCLNCLFATVQAQEFKFGLKGGINKTYGGTLTGIKSAPIYTDATFNAEGEAIEVPLIVL